MNITIESKNFNKGAFPLWRGFRHNWKYNHRTNRLGSFIHETKKEYFTTHTGASGTGADLLNFQDEYTIIDAKNTSFTIQKVSFNLKGKKGNTLAFRKDIIIKTNASDKNKNFGALINGFDLVSNTNSSKLHLLDFRLEKIIKNNKVSYAIIGAINLDCKSVECKMNQKN